MNMTHVCFDLHCLRVANTFAYSRDEICPSPKRWRESCKLDQRLHGAEGVGWRTGVRRSSTQHLRHLSRSSDNPYCYPILHHDVLDRRCDISDYPQYGTPSRLGVIREQWLPDSRACTRDRSKKRKSRCLHLFKPAIASVADSRLSMSVDNEPLVFYRSLCSNKKDVDAAQSEPLSILLAKLIPTIDILKVFVFRDSRRTLASSPC
jgi:hypothetical protein